MSKSKSYYKLLNEMRSMALNEGSNTSINDFHKYIEKILEARKHDEESFAEVLGAHTYDPLTRINRVQQWEKMLIYEAWRNKDFKAALLGEDQAKKKEAISKYIGDIFTDVNTYEPLSWLDNVNIHFHENTDDDIHVVISQPETKRPLGY